MTNEVFTTDMLKQLRKVMQHKLKPCTEFFGGVTIDVASCKYDGGEATYQLKVRLNNAETREQKDLKDMARLLNLDLDKVAPTQGMKLKLIGYKSKARKMPWIVKDISSTSDRNEYKLTDDQAKRLFGIPEEVS